MTGVCIHCNCSQSNVENPSRCSSPLQSEYGPPWMRNTMVPDCHCGQTSGLASHARGVAGERDARMAFEPRPTLGLPHDAGMGCLSLFTREPNRTLRSETRVQGLPAMSGGLVESNNNDSHLIDALGRPSVIHDRAFYEPSIDTEDVARELDLLNKGKPPTIDYIDKGDGLGPYICIEWDPGLGDSFKNMEFLIDHNVDFLQFPKIVVADRFIHCPSDKALATAKSRTLPWNGRIVGATGNAGQPIERENTYVDSRTFRSPYYNEAGHGGRGYRTFNYLGQKIFPKERLNVYSSLGHVRLLDRPSFPLSFYLEESEKTDAALAAGEYGDELRRCRMVGFKFIIQFTWYLLIDYVVEYKGRYNWIKCFGTCENSSGEKKSSEYDDTYPYEVTLPPHVANGLDVIDYWALREFESGRGGGAWGWIASWAKMGSTPPPPPNSP